ncbi:MAG TPA: DUF5668 domain-containing protein [Candidatus Polarisedimenticolia bacterium]|nr:DUF5668 domain-containing protein [Candidatus Polarisedimenticolia bacterium]
MQPDRVAARRRTYASLSFGTTLVCLGTVLLLNTMGRLGWGVWFDLFRLWPLLLISIGIRTLFAGTRLHPAALLGPLLVVGVVAMTAGRYSGREPAGGRLAAGAGESIAIECGPPLRRSPFRLRVAFTLGRIDLAAGGETGPAAAAPVSAGQDRGMAGSLRYTGDQPRWACSNEGDLWLGRDEPGGALRVVFPFTDHRGAWEARLASPGPVDARFDLLASAASLDLRAFHLSRLDLDMAATTAAIRLGPPAGRTIVRLNGAASDIRIALPERTCFTLSRDRLLSVLDLDVEASRSRRGRRAVGAACPGGGDEAAPLGDTPRYEIVSDLPFSSVRIETDWGG